MNEYNNLPSTITYFSSSFEESTKYSEYENSVRDILFLNLIIIDLKL